MFKVFHFRFQLCFSLFFADAFTFLDFRLAKEAVFIWLRNIYGAGNSPLGLRLLIARES
jgi:hypothetical protein